MFRLFTILFLASLLNMFVGCNGGSDSEEQGSSVVSGVGVGERVSFDIPAGLQSWDVRDARGGDVKESCHLEGNSEIACYFSNPGIMTMYFTVSAGSQNRVIEQSVTIVDKGDVFVNAPPHLKMIVTLSGSSSSTITFEGGDDSINSLLMGDDIAFNLSGSSDPNEDALIDFISAYSLVYTYTDPVDDSQLEEIVNLDSLMQAGSLENLEVGIYDFVATLTDSFGLEARERFTVTVTCAADMNVLAENANITSFTPGTDRFLNLFSFNPDNLFEFSSTNNLGVMADDNVYSWDLDGDGIFDTEAMNGTYVMDEQGLAPGYVMYYGHRDISVRAINKRCGTDLTRTFSAVDFTGNQALADGLAESITVDDPGLPGYYFIQGYVREDSIVADDSFSVAKYTGINNDVVDRPLPLVGEASLATTITSTQRMVLPREREALKVHCDYEVENTLREDANGNYYLASLEVFGKFNFQSDSQQGLALSISGIREMSANMATENTAFITDANGRNITFRNNDYYFVEGSGENEVLTAISDYEDQGIVRASILNHGLGIEVNGVPNVIVTDYADHLDSINYTTGSVTDSGTVAVTYTGGSTNCSLTLFVEGAEGLGCSGENPVPILFRRIHGVYECNGLSDGNSNTSDISIDRGEFYCQILDEDPCGVGGGGGGGDNQDE